MGAVTMKMMSRTSMTSTKGVTLIWEIASLPEEPVSKAMVTHSFEEVALGDVQELRREGVHLRGEHAHLAREAVVHHHRRDGGGEPDGGGDQRFGDPAPD